MPKEKDGQCRQTFGSRSGTIIFCLKKEGHKGDHRGSRVQWMSSDDCQWYGQVPITEALPHV